MLTAGGRVDIQLINNYAFSPALNEKITLAAFLELKDGAKVISLKPFLSKDFRLTDRNVGPP
jgi:H3 lysine-79-specific histone-lysine N-methyltransferase